MGPWTGGAPLKVKHSQRPPLDPTRSVGVGEERRGVGVGEPAQIDKVSPLVDGCLGYWMP